MLKTATQITASWFTLGVMATGMVSIVPSIAHAQKVSLPTTTVNAPVDLTAKCDAVLAKRLVMVTTAKSTAAVSGWTSVIVRLDGELTADRQKAVTELSGDIYKRLSIIQSVALRIPTRNLAKLASLPFILRLSQDAEVKKNDEFTVLHSVADGAYYAYGLTGSGVGVAVLDSGITPNADLVNIFGVSRVLANVNFASDSTTADLCGHGSHVAGIIGGDGSNSSNLLSYRTFYGIARNTNLINVRVLNAQGGGTVSSVVSGLGWIIQNKSKYNIRVANLSLGHGVGESYKTDPLCQAVEAAYRAGITVVCAAGNNGRLNTTQTTGASNEGWGTAYGSIQSPANDPYVITVGAAKQNPVNPYNRYQDLIATYSSRGPTRYDYTLKPDIIAPGNSVISLNVPNSYINKNYGASTQVPLNYYQNLATSQPSSTYCRLSGTSMAAPVVAGAVALMLQMDPNLTPDTIKARLMISADKMRTTDGKYDLCTYGAGYLNIPTALNTWVTANRPALSPPLRLSSDGKNVAVDPQQVIWGPPPPPPNTPPGTPVPNTVWGAENVSSLQVIWGGGTQMGQFPIDGQTILTNCLLNPGAVASSKVWADQVIWGGGSTVTVDLSSLVLYGEP